MEARLSASSLKHVVRVLQYAAVGMVLRDTYRPTLQATETLNQVS